MLRAGAGYVKRDRRPAQSGPVLEKLAAATVAAFAFSSPAHQVSTKDNPHRLQDGDIFQARR
jgi:hypothetical protein